MARLAPHLLVFLFLLPATFAQGPPSLSSYANSATLEQDKFYLFWSINDTEKTLHIAVQARTSGWVAVGFSEVGAMVGSDVIMGWVDDDMAVVTDRFIFNKSYDASGVALDRSQDVRIVAGMEYANQSSGDTWTMLQFWRPLNTSDCNDRAISPGEHVSLIWAMGEGDTPSYHGAASRGGTSLVLYPGDQFAITGRQVPSTPDTVAVRVESKKMEGGIEDGVRGRGLFSRRGLVNVKEGVESTQAATPSATNPATLKQEEDWLNMTTTSYTVSTNFTSYICNAFNLTYSSKKHVVEWGVILNTTNPEAVHHAVIWACTDTDQPTSSPNYECYNSGGCSKYLAVWAVGGLPVVLPPAAGLPVGPGGYTRLVLQMHFTNPDGLDSIVDSSGIYLKLSGGSLREFDAGILDVGAVNAPMSIRIPALQAAWTEDRVCPSACTEKLANTSEGVGTNVTVFASLMHLHEVGRQLYTDLYRNGSKILSIQRQDYYDFAYQQFKDLSPGFYILPGDELRTRCVWDTRSRRETTVGGFATTDEMCINYLLYYPARDALGSCFNFCMPKDGKTGPLVEMANCGTSMVPLSDTCPADFMGTNRTAFETLAGCGSNTLASMADVDLGSLSVEVGKSMNQPGVDPKGSGGRLGMGRWGLVVSIAVGFFGTLL